MTDIDILKHSQEYIQKQSYGLDPLTDESATESNIICQLRIQNCLAYVEQYLGRRLFQVKNERKFSHQ